MKIWENWVWPRKNNGRRGCRLVENEVIRKTGCQSQKCEILSIFSGSNPERYEGSSGWTPVDSQREIGQVKVLWKPNVQTLNEVLSNYSWLMYRKKNLCCFRFPKKVEYLGRSISTGNKERITLMKVVNLEIQKVVGLWWKK